MHVTTIVGLMYGADIYHPDCLVSCLVVAGTLPVHALDVAPLDSLRAWAVESDVDLIDESSYDSFDFPKICLATDVAEDDICGRCSLTLLDYA